MKPNSTETKTETGARVLPFEAGRVRRTPRVSTDPTNEAREVVAVVTVTRFIAGEKVHAQVPVFADQILTAEMTAEDLKLTAELSELLADGAVEANSYLDRVAAVRAGRPLAQFHRPSA